MAHEFFDELREPDCTLPSKTALPPLFNFTEAELKNADELRSKLVPKNGLGEAVKTEVSNQEASSNDVDIGEQQADDAAAVRQMESIAAANEVEMDDAKLPNARQ
jgi:hypothetical protein